jgi:DHA2 family multidrug resistance protein
MRVLRSRIPYKWLVAISVCLSMFMSLMDHTIVNVSIATMQRTFGANLRDVQWVVTIYMLTQAAVVPTAPYLTARFGSKRAYVWTLVAFLLGSVLCGFAWNLPSLIAFRLIQGIGGGIVMPMSMTLMYQSFSTEERGTATSMVGIPLMIAPVFGPALGGYLTSAFGWPWAFFINVPLGIVAVIIAQTVLVATAPKPETRFDLAGFLAVAAGCATLLYGIAVLSAGDSSLGAFSWLGGGVVLLSSFVVIEAVRVRRNHAPLLDLRRFGDRTFTFSSFALIFHSIAQYGINFLFPIYLQEVRLVSALEAGAIIGAQALVTLAVMPFAGRLSDKIGPRPIVMVGFALLVGTFAFMQQIALNTPIGLLVGILALLGCAGALIGQLQVLAMSRIAREEQREVANGSTILTVLRSITAPIGVALLSGLVQAHSQQSNSVQGAAGVLAQQNTLLAMHTSFLVAMVMALIALGAICCVPPRARRITPHPEQLAGEL